MDPLHKPSDRGLTPFFHGRKPILKSFEKSLINYKKINEGTIFLVQGPPGIGKSALLAECWKKAKRKKWEVRKLVISALWNPQEMRKCLKLDAEARPVEKTMGGEGRAGLPDLGLGVRGSLEATSVFDTEMPTPRDLIRKIKDPLLLILDEAQHLGEDSRITGAYKDDVRDFLNQIHNGELGKPVILLAGGLGMTHAAFRALGISRMAEKCKFDMEPLEKEEEWLIIRDWLKKAGKATGDVTHWTDTITTETVQWPRHVDSYARNAARLIKDNHGQMTEDLLRSVMEEGRANRMEYYQARLDDFTAKECRSFARILLASSGECGIEQEVAVDQLDKEYGAGKGAELFFRAVRRGVFHIEGATKLYSAPIPSLREYIIKNFPPKSSSS